MIKRFFTEVAEAFSSSGAAETSAADREAAIRKATAVLMLDVARADYVFEESEFQRVLELVERHFGLSPEENGTTGQRRGRRSRRPDLRASIHRTVARAPRRNRQSTHRRIALADCLRGRAPG